MGLSLYRSARILSVSSVRVLSSAGKYGVKLGVLPGAGGTLTQTVQLVPGSTYQVSFSARAVLAQVTTCATVIAESSFLCRRGSQHRVTDTGGPAAALPTYSGRHS